MRISFRHRRLAVMSAVILAGVAGVSVRFGRGSDSLAPPGAAAIPEGEKSTYVGARFCGQCHEQPGYRNTDYVDLTEYKTWSTQDKHAQAYRVLTDTRSQQMGKILCWEVKKDARCLNCHAANVPQELQSNDFDISDGVSCDTCHGPASRWIVPHADKKWRSTPPADKQKLGMRNVRDPIEQARLCVSCHVGCVAEGRVVTHEMYAAGHPPLPSIEISTFCDFMPPHWRKKNDGGKRTVLGAVVTFQAAMELLSAASGANKDRIDISPELAHYDCYACHHELKTPSWRQKRGYAGRPGRPPMHAWPTVLLEDALRYAGAPQMAKQYEERMLKLRQAFDARPFGDGKHIAERANELRQWSDRLLERLQKAPFDSPSARRLLRGLCAAEEADKLDYDSARQKAWAINAILKQLESAERVEKSLAAFRRQLNLGLSSATEKQILGLAERMRLVNDYDPEQFKTVLEKLGPLLSQE
jgi:Zn finger protein HypA/HybF involved in hydrogenase expression